MKFISLTEAQKQLGKNVFIVLESQTSAQAKRDAGKEVEIWGFDLDLACLQRPDGKFRKSGILLHPAGYYALGVVEEPNLEREPNQFCVVGHVIVDVNPRGLIRTRKNKGFNGAILELKPSSLSKGELAESGREPEGLGEANAQVIEGMIAFFRNDVEFPDEEGMTPERFVNESTDLRSIGAIAKLGLLNK